MVGLVPVFLSKNIISHWFSQNTVSLSFSFYPYKKKLRTWYPERHTSRVRLHLNYLKRRRSTLPRGREKGSFFKCLQFEWNKVHHQGGSGICVIYSGFSAETIVRISPEMLRTFFMKLTITLYKYCKLTPKISSCMQGLLKFL
jgi:hypothetical protein